MVIDVATAMFGIYSFGDLHRTTLKSEVIFADKRVIHERDAARTHDKIMQCIVSNADRPAYAVYSRFPAGHIYMYDWCSEIQVGNRIYDVGPGNFANIINTKHGAFFTKMMTAVVSIRLVNGNGVVVRDDLSHSRLIAERGGERVYVTDLYHTKCAPMGEILPCGWYLPIFRGPPETGTRLILSGSYCANDNICVYNTRNALYGIDTRIPDEIIYAGDVGLPDIRDRQNGTCVFVTDVLLAVHVYNDAESMSCTRIFDMRVPGTTYDLPAAVSKPPGAWQKLLAC